jgi:translation elongation factor EF-1beta
MGEVAVTFKVFVEDMSMFDAVKKELEKAGAKSMKDEEVGFGIKTIKAVFIIPDGEGQIDKLEAKVSSLKGVSEIRAEEMGRLM